jgi:signal peptidase I
MSTIHTYNNTALRQMLFENGIISLTVHGSSMEPSIVNGQIITVKKFTGKLYKGKCYVFSKSHQLIVHRFVGNKYGKAIFMGDWSAKIDIINHSKIIGEVIEPSNRYQDFIFAIINFLYFHISLYRNTILCKARKYFIKTLIRV